MIKSNTYMRYLRLGLNVRPVRGRSVEHQEHAHAYHVDGVQYVLNDFGEYEETFDSTTMINSIQNMYAIVGSNRHDRVLAVQSVIQKALGKTVWVEVGSELQLSVVYGTKDGVVAHMYMDFSSEEKFNQYADALIQQLKRMGLPDGVLPEVEQPEEFVVIPVDDKYDVIFADMNIPGVIVDFFDDENPEEE